MSRQDQEATGNAVAIQSQRDTIISQGLSATDMREIIESLASQQITYAAVAREIVDARLYDFEQRILERFAKDDKARTEAFKEPDFQYLLSRAQHAHARSGDDTIRDTLVDLITERSKQVDRNRLTLSLNQAVEKAAILTSNEFAELSICYMLRSTQNNSVNTFAKLAAYLTDTTRPFLFDISREESSYRYIEAQGCATVSLSSITLRDLLLATYGGVVTKGWDSNEWTSIVSQYDLLPFANNPKLIVACLHDSSKKQLNAIRKDVFQNIAVAEGMIQSQVDGLWSSLESSAMSRDEMVTALSPVFPEADLLFSLWDETPLKSLVLTPVGTAIAHSNSARLTGLQADLSIWIK